MNKNKITGLICIGILLMLTASSLQGADKTPTKQIDPPLPLERVMKYLADRGNATTLINNKIEKELIGKLYSGIVSVSDVVEGSDDDIIIQVNPPHPGMMYFRVQDASLKDKSGKIRKNDKVLIKAKLDRFWSQSSGYVNVGSTYIAEFNNVQVLDIQPQ